jgi:hypothetical protein
MSKQALPHLILVKTFGTCWSVVRFLELSSFSDILVSFSFVSDRTTFFHVDEKFVGRETQSYAFTAFFLCVSYPLLSRGYHVVDDFSSQTYWLLPFSPSVFAVEGSRLLLCTSPLFLVAQNLFIHLLASYLSRHEDDWPWLHAKVP